MNTKSVEGAAELFPQTPCGQKATEGTFDTLPLLRDAFSTLSQNLDSKAHRICGGVKVSATLLKEGGQLIRVRGDVTFFVEG